MADKPATVAPLLIFIHLTAPMKNALLAGLIPFMLLLSACQNNPPVPDNSIDTNASAQEYLIGAFNLRNFGPARVEKPQAMQALVNILRRYDLVVLIELRDRTGGSFAELLAQINAQSGHQYALELSQRSGRGNRKEQYGFLYRLDRVNILDFYDYDDGLEPDLDSFEREPAVAYIDLAGLTLTLIAIHADPDTVALELNRLIPVYEDAVQRTGDSDAIILGDFNADCSFLPARDKPFINLLNDDRFIWLLGDEVDTTVRASTDCAYDRIVVTKTLNRFLPLNAASVYDYSTALGLDEITALEVSDHFPVELRLIIQP